MPRHLLIILDGLGIADDPSVSAPDLAQTPFLDHLFATYPHSTLEASGTPVGLPKGQMGNSEVGHMNLGAGRIVWQDIAKIDNAIETGDFFENEVLLGAVRHAKERGTKLHLLGLFSDGGVHASLDHLYALLELAKREGQERVYVHAFTDGRDTDPNGGAEYAREFERRAQEIGVGEIASVIGRYYAMDRDNRWDRVERAYRLLTTGEGQAHPTANDALVASYEASITDEFAEPSRIETLENSRIESGDAVIFFNFRSDRARELTAAFTTPEFDAEDGPYGDTFDRGELLDLHYVTFARYHADFTAPVAFPKENLDDTIGEVIAAHGLTQLRAAETEKYPHVTFFFSGGREIPFDGEARILVASPKVATYDLQPEMSAPELASRVAEALVETQPTLAVLNFANPDMVGHTGDLAAAIKAVEAVDACTKQVVEAALSVGYGVTIIADHGNCDRMRNPDGTAHTAHTTVLVPHLIIAGGVESIRPGKLGDVAPTILALLGIEQPAAMTGEVLV